MEIPTQLKKENLRFCRIRKGTKKPFEKNWTNKPYTWQEIQKFENENYGVLCGYGDLAVIDCDREELQILIENALPETYKVKTGGGGVHFYYFIPELKQKIILEIKNNDEVVHLGEIQSYGTQVVAPSSVHPNGKEYEELNQNEIISISCERLYRTLKKFMKEYKEAEESAMLEKTQHSEIDDLSVAEIFGISGLKKQRDEYYGPHPIHGSEGGMNFWINPSKNIWHCFRCNSGGGPLSAIAVKEKIIDCSDAQKGYLRGDKAIQCIEIAREKYRLKDRVDKIEKAQINDENEIKVIWDRDLENYQEEEKEWIVEKLIPAKSVCVLTGKRGTMKTFIALLIGYSVASNNEFLNYFPTKGGGVIYLDKENGISIMKTRTDMIKKGLELNNKNLKIGFICFSQLKIDKTKDINQIEDLIKKENPLLLIIDTYRRGISFDENDAGAVSQLFVDTLRPLVEKYNLSIILIHHNRKGIGEKADEMDEIRGSSDLANYSDIILKTERKSNHLILKQLKNRNAEEIKPIKIDMEFKNDYLKMEYAGEYLKQNKSDKCVEILSIWINENKISQFRTGEAKEIAFKSGIKETNFKTALQMMCDIGEIENSEFGMYKVLKNDI